MGERTNPAANADMGLRAEAAPRSSLFVQIAPGPETPDARDRAGAQAGMALALTVGGAFWGLVGAAAIYFLHH